MLKDYVRIAIIWIVLTALGELLVSSINFAPPPASIQGEVIDGAFGFLMVASIPVFAFVMSVLVYSLFRFRAKEGDDEDGPPLHSNRTVWIIWLVVTTGLAALILINPGITGVLELRAMEQDPDMVIQIEAEQWNWNATYADYDLTLAKIDELVLPADTRIRFEITGRDVLHSFWIPALRMKQDAVPGRTTSIVVTTTTTGSYADDPDMRLQCAELCGTGHARMWSEVRVVDQAEFDEWIEAGLEAQGNE